MLDARDLWVCFRTIRNKSAQEKRLGSCCSETREMQGMCKRLARGLDPDRSLRKGMTQAGWLAALCLLCSPPRRLCIYCNTPHPRTPAEGKVLWIQVTSSIEETNHAYSLASNQQDPHFFHRLPGRRLGILDATPRLTGPGTAGTECDKCEALRPWPLFSPSHQPCIFEHFAPLPLEGLRAIVHDVELWTNEVAPGTGTLPSPLCLCNEQF